MGYIVKAYDPLGRVPDYFRTTRDTWHRDRTQAMPFASEKSACDFIVNYRSTHRHLGELDLCVESI